MSYIISNDPCDPMYISEEEREEQSQLREEAEIERAEYNRENF